MRLWHSGKFWLKLGCYGTLAAALLVISAHILLLHLFTADKIRHAAEEALVGSGRQIRFAENIGRSWFPRPTSDSRFPIQRIPDDKANPNNPVR